MTNTDLAKSYIWKAETRIDALEALNKRGNFSDVVREARETVELALKGMLRGVGVEPPKHHDVGRLLLEHRETVWEGCCR
jgi:HEPN domain-containing protein